MRARAESNRIRLAAVLGRLLECWRLFFAAANEQPPVVDAALGRDYDDREPRLMLFTNEPGRANLRIYEYTYICMREGEIWIRL
jgi:hypothetical protein